jgi:hypothetical protein
MTTQDSRSGGIGLFAMGLTLGLSVGSIGVYVWQQREFQKFRRQAAEQLEAIQAGKEIVGDLIIPAGNKSPDSVEDRIQKLGDECVEDLRNDRLLSVYRMTTPAYQLRMPREQFDEMVHRAPKLRHMLVAATLRDSKVRLSADNKRGEYYCTSNLLSQGGVVNIALTFVDVDGQWLIDDIELRQDT